MNRGLRNIFRWTLVLLAAWLLAGCAPKAQYAPLERVSFNQDLPVHEGRTMVLFEPIFPGKPLRETVWDNVEGARWSHYESGRASWVPTENLVTRISGPPVSQNRLEAGDQVLHQMTVPFGAILTAKYKGAFDRAYPGWRVCEDEQCLQTHSKLMDFDRIIRIKVDRFDLWEQPPGYVNFYMHGTWTETKANGLETRTVRYEKERLQVRLDGDGYQDNDRARQLLQLINNFAEETVYRHLGPKDNP
jgi:hypothetical protein